MAQLHTVYNAKKKKVMSLKMLFIIYCSEYSNKNNVVFLRENVRHVLNTCYNYSISKMSLKLWILWPIFIYSFFFLHCTYRAYSFGSVYFQTCQFFPQHPRTVFSPAQTNCTDRLNAVCGKVPLKLYSRSNTMIRLNTTIWLITRRLHNNKLGLNSLQINV